MMNSFIILALLAFLCSTTIVFGFYPPRESYPQIIAHRGAAGYVPEHSLQGYQLAIDLDTDYIEPDLVLTRDGVFVCMHDVLLDSTTDVASKPRFADRYTTKEVSPGVNMTGFFVIDFLYSELQELRLNQRVAGRTTLYNGLFKIPSFDSVMSLVAQNYAKNARTIGIYPELKRPIYHKVYLSLSMEDLVLQSLSKGGYATANDDTVPRNLSQVVPVAIQCFDPQALVYLKTLTAIPLVYLFTPITEMRDLELSDARLRVIASYAEAVGPSKDWFEDMSFDAALSAVQTFHAHGLYLTPWTFRADEEISKPFFRNNFYVEEMWFYCCLGIDALFSEFPDRSRETIDLMQNYTQYTSHSVARLRAGKKRQCTINCRKP